MLKNLKNILLFFLDTGFGLPPKDQYIVYGSYFIIISAIYLFIVFILKILSRKPQALE